MKFVFSFLLLLSFIKANTQTEVTGTWVGKIFDTQNINSYDSVSITFNLKLEANNKITGTTTAYYTAGAFAHFAVSGKLYKKKDGFYVQEDKLVESNFRIKIAVHMDRYDFSFLKENPDELEGTSICIKAMSMHVPCHGNIKFTVKKTLLLKTEKIGTDSTTVNQ
jgi:hypothetical protein